MIAVAAAITIAMGVIYLLTAPPSFTATATMLIDTKKIQLFQQQSMFNDIPIDASSVESQVEILKSETIALAVIKHLHLTEDPEFVGSGGGLIGTLLGTGDRTFRFQRTEFRIRVDTSGGRCISKSIERPACWSDLCHPHRLPLAQS